MSKYNNTVVSNFSLQNKFNAYPTHSYKCIYILIFIEINKKGLYWVLIQFVCNLWVLLEYFYNVGWFTWMKVVVCWYGEGDGRRTTEQDFHKEFTAKLF